MGVAPSSPSYPASGYTLFQTVSNFLNSTCVRVSNGRQDVEVLSLRHGKPQFDSTNFFNEFSFFTGGDPTHGYVDYVSQSAAQSSNLAHYANNQVYLGVDTTSYNPGGGRGSVRLTSNLAFGEGLFIADIEHMPTGCGVWPAFWMFGPNWPASGEIDIIEGVNNQAANSITLHTSPGCVVSNANSQSGTYTITTDCNSGNANEGCTTGTSNSNNFGAGFNSVGGGTYAMQWASSGIYVWFWQRGQVPGDISAKEPNTNGWGTPLVTFSGGGCNFDTFFSNMNLVFDTTFCGDWAGSVWSSGSCGSLAPTCSQYVADNPGAFTNAYWLINSVEVYH